MFPWLDVILALAVGLAGLSGGCMLSEPVSLVRLEEAVRCIDEVPPESKQLSGPTAVPSLAPAVPSSMPWPRAPLLGTASELLCLSISRRMAMFGIAGFRQ